MTNEQKDAISVMLTDATYTAGLAKEAGDVGTMYFYLGIVDTLETIFIFSKDNKVVDFNDKKLSKVIKVVK